MRTRETTPMPTPRFTSETLAFLRALARHNDRDWFREHREEYESHVKGPMVALIERLAIDLPGIAPDLAANPKTSMYRIHRDTRFSANKAPYKTHVAAIFPHRALPKHESAGLYVHVATDQVFIGGGLYRPQPRQLHRLREYIATNSERLRGLVAAPAFRRNFGELSGEGLKRVPRGFPADHPAADLLRLKQFLAGCERPAAFAIGPRFYPSLLRLFSHLAPLIDFLNAPLASRELRPEETLPAGPPSN